MLSEEEEEEEDCWEVGEWKGMHPRRRYGNHLARRRWHWNGSLSLENWWVRKAMWRYKCYAIDLSCCWFSRSSCGIEKKQRIGLLGICHQGVEGCGMLWCLDLTYSTRSWCVWGEKLVTSCCVLNENNKMLC
jgi:hypothetical protein